MILCLVASSSSDAVATPARATNPPAFVPGEIVVKFNDTVTQSIADIVEEGRSFRTATTDRSSSLDRLAQQYKVRHVRPVFRPPDEERASPRRNLNQREEAKVGSVKQRFSTRSRRAPGESPPNLSQVYVLELARGADAIAAAAALSADPHVEYAHPNYLVKFESVPNDPYYGSSGSWGQPYDDLWGLKKIQAPDAWDVTQGGGVTVAVVDSGLDYNHPDIATNVWNNSGESPANGIDDDDNGYVDDVRGWDFVTSDGVEDNDPMDGQGHGTHVAGIIAAVGNNSLGVIGVAPEAKVMPVKAFNDQGVGATSDIANALRYATDNGADVINNSWGCAPPPCPSIEVVEDAVQYAHSLGTVIVFSAGNSAQTDVASVSPQNMPETIVVAASNQNDVKTTTSSSSMKVDVAAPGGGTDTPPPTFLPRANVLSLLSSAAPIGFGPGTIPPNLVVGSQYLRQSGTSMAAPHVAAVAALILANQSSFTNEDVRQVLRVSADDIEAPGFDPNSGRGRIDAAQALAVSSVLQAYIAAPRSGLSLTDQSIQITGSAAGPGFANYQLSYGTGWAPTTWLPLSAVSPTPVEDGVLATWNVQALPAGEYTIRLVVTSAEGTVYDAYVPFPREDTFPLATIGIAFESDRLPGGPDIYGLDSQALMRLTDDPAAEGEPAWSPDGERLAFVSDRDGNSDIYVMNADGSGLTNLTRHPAEDVSPTWSSDGTRIAFATNRDANWEIYTMMGVDGSWRVRLTADAADDTSPSWDPAGSLIAFVSRRDGNSEIYAVSSFNASVYRLTSNPAEDTSPAWSSIWTPGGQRIAFASDRDGNSEIYTMKPDGTLQTRLTNDFDEDREPAWSPDGQRIAYVRDQDGNADIHVMSASGATIGRVTSNTAQDAGPSWVSPQPNAPRLAPIGNRAAIEGTPLQITVHATDANGGPLNYSMWTQTPGATFADQTFTWIPTSQQVRTDPYPFWFYASDGQAQDSETIWITVLTSTGDADFDQLMNADEFNVYHTNPIDNDTDNDYLSDYLEVTDYQTDPLVADSDRDGCLDSNEVWNSPEAGGERDPLSFWDFMDVWNGLPVERDRVIGVGDIGGVVARFGTGRATPPTPAEALAEALTPPAATTGYHAAFDRGGGTPGGDPWDLLSPNGTISVGDIGAVVAQFGHSCI